MAFNMKFKHPTNMALITYWRVGEIRINPDIKSGMIRFFGYPTKEDFDHDNNLSPVFSKAYELTPDNFDAGVSMLSLNLSQLLSPCYSLAKAIPEESGRSFFEDAEEV